MGVNDFPEFFDGVKNSLLDPKLAMEFKNTLWIIYSWPLFYIELKS